MTSQQMEYDALQRQLERMRAMQYGYFSRFFHWITLTAGVFVVLWLLPFAHAQALLPFLVVTAGVQASFFLHFVDFARTHATALEAQINRVIGREVLVGSELEDAYFYPLRDGKFSGFLPKTPGRFFSVYTLHWCGVWTLFYVSGLLRAWPDAAPYQTFYAILLATWTMGHVVYLAWYFGRQQDRQEVERLLALRYGLPGR